MRTGPRIWVPSGIVVAPVDQQILCSSPALAAGAWLISVVGQTDASFHFRVLAVTANLVLAERRPAAGDIDFMVPNSQRFVQGEVIRVICIDGAPGASPHVTLHGEMVE